jgi:hypothetical protein
VSTAIGLYRAMDMAFWLSRAEAELAQVAGVAATSRSMAVIGWMLPGVANCQELQWPVFLLSLS